MALIKNELFEVTGRGKKILASLNQASANVISNAFAGDVAKIFWGCLISDDK